MAQEKTIRTTFGQRCHDKMEENMSSQFCSTTKFMFFFNEEKKYKSAIIESILSKLNANQYNQNA